MIENLPVVLIEEETLQGNRHDPGDVVGALRDTEASLVFQPRSEIFTLGNSHPLMLAERVTWRRRIVDAKSKQLRRTWIGRVIVVGVREVHEVEVVLVQPLG